MSVQGRVCSAGTAGSHQLDLLQHWQDVAFTLSGDLTQKTMNKKESIDEGIVFPDHPCMAYLPTSWWFGGVNAGIYSIHVWSGF